MKEFAKSFYNSTQWRKCRKSFIAERISIDGGMCQECKEELGYIVDHVNEITPSNINDPNITLNYNNFRYLCLVCHNKKTFCKEIDEPTYFFNERGQVMPLPPKNIADKFEN